MPDDPTAGDPATSSEAAPEAASQTLHSTSWVLPVATAAVLIAFFCLYYFVYVRAQREYLVNRNFRALAALGDQLQAQITIHGSILEFYADLVGARRHEKGSDRKRVNFEKQILVVRAEDKGLKQEGREARKDYMKYLAPTFELADPPPPIQKQSEGAYRLTTLHRNGRWLLEFNALREAGGKTDYRGALVLEDLFQPLVGSLPFDDILLASDSGEIVYQSKKNGPRFTTLAALLDNQPGGAEKKPVSKAEPPPKGESTKRAEDAPKAEPVSMHLTDVALTGTSYKLFLQPVLIDAFSDDPAAKEERHHWMLCGLRSSATLDWEAMAISYTVIIWLTFLLFAIFMLGPILKLFLMNHRERLPLRDLGFLGLFLVLLSGVFTLAGLQAAYFNSSDDSTEGQLRQLSEKFSRDIRLELRLMRDQLVAMCQTEGLAHDLHRAATEEVTRQRIADPEAKEAPSSTRMTIDRYSAEVAQTARIYPNFNNAFWTDDDGIQVVKWSSGDYVTPLIDVSVLRAFNEPKTTYLDAQFPPLRFDSVLPPNRVEYLATLIMSTKDCNPRLDESIRGDVSGGQSFLTAQPFSLIDPALPFGYAFALIDQSGLVLFHSDKTRNKRENFLQESEWNRELVAAAFGHATEGSIEIKYLGKDYRAFVVPIAGLSQAPLSLIVYRDLTTVRTLDLQSMTMASSLFLVFLAGPFLFLVLWFRIHRPPYAPECVWPNPARMTTYAYQIALYALLTAAFLFLGFGASAEQTVIACAAVPYTALLMTFWCFRVYLPPGQECARRGRWPLFPAAISGLAAIAFLSILIGQWPKSKDLTVLLGVCGIAVFPLLRRPRVHIARTIRRWSAGGGATGGSSRHPGPRPLGYRACYALSVLLLLFLIGVLPPIALFRASLSVERRLQVKQAQLHLASTLEQHQRSIDDQHENGDRGDFAYGEFFRDTSDASKWTKMKFIPLFLPDGKPSIEDHSATGGAEIYSDWFRRLVYSLHHDYNDAAAETLGVISDRPNSDLAPDWTWRDQGSTITLVWHGAHPRAQVEEKPAKEHDLVISSIVPGFAVRDTWSAVEIAAGVMLVMGILFWALARRLFLFQIAPLKLHGHLQVAEALRDGRNVLILLPPVSDWQWEERTFKMDLVQFATRPKWAELVDLNMVPRRTLIEIQHFEHTTGDPEIDNQKLRLLERLIHRRDTQVVAVMTVNPSPVDYRRLFPGLEVVDLREEPFQWRAAYEGPARDLIWRECGPLPALWPIGARLAQDLRAATTDSGDTIASEVLERADPYYRMIWDECSKEQQFVLAQLAVDGLLNPTNGRVVRQLVRRGLIAKDPQFRIMNESFRQFLRSAATPALRQEWQREARQSGWGKAHGVVFSTLVLVGVFLLATQNGLLQSSAGYVTTALTALATFGKLFSTVRGGGGSVEKPG